MFSRIRRDSLDELRDVCAVPSEKSREVSVKRMLGPEGGRRTWPMRSYVSIYIYTCINEVYVLYVFMYINAFYMCD